MSLPLNRLVVPTIVSMVYQASTNSLERSPGGPQWPPCLLQARPLSPSWLLFRPFTSGSPKMSRYFAGTCWFKVGPPGSWTKETEKEDRSFKWLVGSIASCPSWAHGLKILYMIRRSHQFSEMEHTDPQTRRLTKHRYENNTTKRQKQKKGSCSTQGETHIQWYQEWSNQTEEYNWLGRR